MSLTPEQLDKLETMLPELSFPSLLAIQIRLNREIGRRFGEDSEFTDQHVEQFREAASQWPDSLVKVAAQRFEKSADSCEVGTEKVRLEQAAEALYAELACRGEPW